MSRIEELIKEKCPDGVEYKKLGTLCEKIKNVVWDEETKYYIDLSAVSIELHSILENGIVQITKDSAPSRAKQVVKGNDILFGGTRPMQGRICMVPDKYTGYIASTGFNIVRIKDKAVLNKYVYHCMNSSNFYAFVESMQHGASYPAINDSEMKEYEIPIPPMEIQQEIVRILDSFTELEAGLQAEMEARKKQYEYYKDFMLSRSDKLETVRLDVVCEIYDGTHQTPKYIESGVPFVSVENIDDLNGTEKYISAEDYQKFKIKPQIGDVFMTRITAGVIGKCAVVNSNKDIAYYVSLALLRPDKEKLNSYYLKYYLESSLGKRELAKRILWDATPTKINKDDIGKVLITIPSVEVQEEIVQVLDSFDEICCDMNVGLPAEIETRHKQYEYYRDKLLTFERKVV